MDFNAVNGILFCMLFKIFSESIIIMDIKNISAKSLRAIADEHFGLINAIFGETLCAAAAFRTSWISSEQRS